MVTTRSQDKMTFADKIRAKGFSLADCKFFKLNALFPIMLDVDLVRTQVWLTGLYVAVRVRINLCSTSRTTDRFHTGHDHGRGVRALPRDDAAALRLDAAATARGGNKSTTNTHILH